MYGMYRYKFHIYYVIRKKYFKCLSVMKYVHFILGKYVVNDIQVIEKCIIHYIYAYNEKWGFQFIYKLFVYKLTLKIVIYNNSYFELL